MAIERYTADSGSTHVTTTECVFCGADLPPGHDLPTHLRFHCPENGEPMSGVNGASMRDGEERDADA